VANSFVVRLKCPYGDRDGWLILQDREETLIQILATPWDFECRVHGVQRALPVEVSEKRPSTASSGMATQIRFRPPTARIFLGLAAAVTVGAIALSGLILFRRSLGPVELRQAALMSAPKGVATVKELAEPWSSKTFAFHSPGAKENISSVVVRLPNRHLTNRVPTGLFHCGHHSSTVSLNTSLICRSFFPSTGFRRNIPWWAILVAMPFLILSRWRICPAVCGLAELS